MSIELYELARSALLEGSKLEHLQDMELRFKAIQELTAAIQQAEAQQPATGEPVANDEAPPDGMAWFYCSTPIKEASGWQYWRVAGRNLSHAKEQFERGEGEIVEQEVEVTDLEPPEWVAIDAAMLTAAQAKKETP